MYKLKSYKVNPKYISDIKINKFIPAQTIKLNTEKKELTINDKFVCHFEHGKFFNSKNDEVGNLSKEEEDEILNFFEVLLK